jgi:hypothetical protein
LRAPITTVIPCLANCLLISKPMPLLAPVISATLLSFDRFVINLLGHSFERRKLGYACMDEERVNTPELFLLP